jgi:hypothetical protein
VCTVLSGCSTATDVQVCLVAVYTSNTNTIANTIAVFEYSSTEQDIRDNLKFKVFTSETAVVAVLQY